MKIDLKVDVFGSVIGVERYTLDKILNNMKRQTIQTYSQTLNSLREGDELILFANNKKIGSAIVECVQKLTFAPMFCDIYITSNLGNLALSAADVCAITYAEGYRVSAEFWKYFFDRYGSANRDMVVIQWRDFVPVVDILAKGGAR